MAKVISCQKCGTEFSKAEKACPHCGAKVKTSLLKKILYIWIALAIVSLTYRTVNDDPKNEKLIEAVNEAASE